MKYLIVCVYAVNMIDHANTDNFVKSLAHGENNIDIWFYNPDTCSNLFSWVQKTFLKILVSTTIDNLYMNLKLENLGEFQQKMVSPRCILCSKKFTLFVTNFDWWCGCLKEKIVELLTINL
jgi:hypothetical protein